MRRSRRRRESHSGTIDAFNVKVSLCSESIRVRVSVLPCHIDPSVLRRTRDLAHLAFSTILILPSPILSSHDFRLGFADLERHTSAISGSLHHSHHRLDRKTRFESIVVLSLWNRLEHQLLRQWRQSSRSARCSSDRLLLRRHWIITNLLENHIDDVSVDFESRARQVMRLSRRVLSVLSKSEVSVGDGSLFRHMPRGSRSRLSQTLIIGVSDDRVELLVIQGALEVPIAKSRSAITTRMSQSVRSRDDKHTQIDGEMGVFIIRRVTVDRVGVSGENVVGFSEWLTRIRTHHFHSLHCSRIGPSGSVSSVGSDPVDDSSLVEITHVSTLDGFSLLLHLLNLLDVAVIQTISIVPLTSNQLQKVVSNGSDGRQRFTLDNFARFVDNMLVVLLSIGARNHFQFCANSAGQKLKPERGTSWRIVEELWELLLGLEHCDHLQSQLRQSWALGKVVTEHTSQMGRRELFDGQEQVQKCRDDSGDRKLEGRKTAIVAYRVVDHLHCRNVLLDTLDTGLLHTSMLRVLGGFQTADGRFDDSGGLFQLDKGLPWLCVCLLQMIVPQLPGKLLDLALLNILSELHFSGRNSVCAPSRVEIQWQGVLRHDCRLSAGSCFENEASSVVLKLFEVISGCGSYKKTHLDSGGHCVGLTGRCRRGGGLELEFRRFRRPQFPGGHL